MTAELKSVPTLESSIERYNHLKDKQDSYTALVKEKRAEIIQMVGHNEEGAKSKKTDDFKVTTTGKLKRTANFEKAMGIYKTLNADEKEVFNKVFVRKFDVSVKAFKAVRDANKDLFKKLVEAISTKPESTALVIKALEE